MVRESTSLIFFPRIKKNNRNSRVKRRLTCGQQRFLSFPTSFLPSLFASTAHNWSQIHDIQRKDVFSYDALFVPFSADERTTLFVVIGAGNVQKYQKNNFAGNRPCILEFNPYVDEISRHHLPSVTSKIYAWLNRLYRERTGGDYLSNPFHKRSMPLCSPFGKHMSSPFVLDADFHTTSTHIQ